MARSKKSKADVSQEEMGTFSHSNYCGQGADVYRGLPDVEAGLRRSDGELQGRGGLVMCFVAVVMFSVV